MRTLKIKLLAAFMGVIIITVGTVTLYVRQSTEQEIEVYEERTELLYLIRMEHWLLGYYAHGSGWDDITIYLEEMEVLSGQRVVLTDAERIVIADSHGELEGDLFSYDWPHRELIRHRDRMLLGILFISPEPTLEAELTRELAASIQYYLIIGASAAVAVAFLLTIILSRAIASPAEALAEAAQRIGKGDFSVQVKIRDRGEFGALADAFNRMSSDLEQTQRMRRDLTADIAHELRSPLTNIRGYLEAVADNLIPSSEALPLLEEETSMLAHLIEDLQVLALAEAGALELKLSEVNVSAVTELAVKRIEPLAREKGITLASDIPASIPLVTADSKRVTQVLSNLLSNALTHTESGGSIRVGLACHEAMVCISVTDSGIGIPEREISRVFDRFYRVDRSRSRSTGGSGLGLTIAKYLVEAHGGTIHAESIPGKGSTFSFTIPHAGINGTGKG